MRDAKNLPFGGDLFHLFANGMGGFAADVRVHFIKH